MVVDADACGIETTGFFLFVFLVLFFHWKVKILEFIQGFRSFSLHNKVYGGRFRQIKGTVVVRLFYNRIFELSPTGLLLNLCEWMNAKGVTVNKVEGKGNLKRLIKTVLSLF